MPGGGSGSNAVAVEGQTETYQSSWEQPETYDESLTIEYKYERACELLIKFYTQYNPNKYGDIDAILLQYRNKYSDLFVQLANRYELQDMDIFQGIDFDK